MKLLVGKTNYIYSSSLWTQLLKKYGMEADEVDMSLEVFMGS